jgi:hypothetical protein
VKPRHSFLLKSKLALLTCVLAITFLVKSNAGFEDLNSSAAEANIDLAETEYSSDELAFLDALDGDETLQSKVRLTSNLFAYTPVNGLESKANVFCERFLDRNGKYGIYGKVISDYLRKKYSENRSSPMLADDVVGMTHSPNICPNWRNLTINGRIKFWVWTFAAIASVESTCGASSRAMRGVHGMHGLTAIGLLQMEKQIGPRLDRPKSCKVSPGEIAHTYSNLRCGLDIMEGLISSDPPNKPNPWPIYQTYKNTHSYWQDLQQPDGNVIGHRIRAFSPCYERSSVWSFLEK